MKARAPPPPVPPASRKSQEERKSSIDARMAGDQSPEEVKENMLNRKVEVAIILPSGAENTATVEGSKAMMDLLVELCSRYHLNPAHHFLEIMASETQVPMKFKPNTLIGTLDVHTVHLKEKPPEGKTKKPPPRIPEKSVRLVVNFLRTQKTVLRVNPQVPVRELLLAICEKCEFSQHHAILLRDNVTREALDPSKSLNDLGIKELYVWDSQREANRNLSVRSDSIDKEKRGLLGIFRVNKRNNQDSTTVPNSPSVSTRTVALGTSQSLTNISGIGERTEVKKRRAPPPPTAMMRQASCSEDSGEDMQSVQILQASQNDLQTKKRRAPAPPVPVMPNNTVEEKKNRRSAIGNERQVPQKPPRGNTPRAPPRLVLPPPPPYPPPDIMEPLEFQGQADFSDISEVTLEPGWQLAPGSSIYIDDDDGDDLVMYTSEVEESNSVNSCLASEGTTEDSGTVSSQSDNASLDYQSDIKKQHDRPLWGQENTSETDVTYTAKMCPVRNTSINSDDSWAAPQSPVSRDEDLMAVRSGEEDMFITAQFEQTLADLVNEDSEGMEDNDYSTSGFSESSPTAEVSSPYQYVDESGTDVAVAVPVTVIDEVPDVRNYSPECYEEGMQTSKIYAHSKDLKLVGNLVNENNNIYSFDKQSSVIGQLHTNGNLSESGICHINGSISESRMSSTNENLPVRRASHENISLNGITYPNKNHTNENSSDDKLNFRVVHNDSVQLKRSSFDNELTAETTRYASESKGTSGEQSPQVCSPVSEPVEHNTSILFDKNGNRRAWNKSTTEPDLGRIQPTTSDVPKSPVLRWQQNYEPKAGLTTFKVVPPKPGVRQYDRGVSLSSSAIKIDELGNLVNPHSSVEKKDTPGTSANDTEGSLLRRAKAFWRSNSSDKQTENSTEEAHKKPLSPTTTKAHNQETESKVTVLKEKTESHQTLPSKMSWPNSDLKEFQSPQVLKMPTAAEINRARGDLSFLKPYRRTSSQYVASAITRYTRTQSQSTEGESKHEDRHPTVTLEPKEKKCIILSKYMPVERQNEIGDTNQDYNSFKHTEWNRLSHSADCRIEKTNTVEPFYDRNHVTFSNSINAQHSKPSSREPIIKIIPGYDSSSEAADKVSNTFLAQRCEAGDDVDFSPAQDSQGTCLPHASSGSFSGSMEDDPQSGTRTGHVKHSFAVNSELARGQATENTNNKPLALPRRISLEYDTLVENSVFGPKKRFRPVVQKPAQKDTSPHSALMESIQSGEGKQRLRSIQDSGSGINGSCKKSSFSETENERSALLSAIRAYSGNTRLRKISSSASEELQNIRNKELQIQVKENRDIPPPPIMPPPPLPPSVPGPAPKFSVSYKEKSVNAREELMEAIRSGSNARLKKVSPSPNTL